jgi:mannosylglycerate hydrolase
MTQVSHLEDPTRKPWRILVFHHTHWDREWWATYQDFRIRLVEVIDQLLDTLDSDPGFKSFFLDSQTVVLRDYLEVRPYERRRLTEAIRAGRIQCGPWYILPDEFLVSGESHIRNLWLGRRVAAEFDIPLQQVGYLPDTFGHIAQMPQILRGFGIDNAFVWRGYGGGAAAKQDFHWEAPDGSGVLAMWFPDGYYQMPFLHFGNPDRPYADKLGRIFQAIERWGPRATTDVLLMPYGGDHRPMDPQLAAKIEEANTAIDALGSIAWSTLSDYVAAIRAAAPGLETVRGELRALGPEHPHLLSGVLSARLNLKRLNFLGQTWLERYAEPLAALAWADGRRYDASLLWKAWDLLVQNHPHDSICGCSIDQVHREMLSRFAQSRQIAEIVSEQSAQYLNGRIDAPDCGPNDLVLIARNTLPWRRSALVTAWTPRSAVGPRTHRLLDSAGTEIPFQSRDVTGARPMTDRSEWTEIAFIASDVPPLGHAAFRLTTRDAPVATGVANYRAHGPVAARKGSAAIGDLRIGPGRLENGYLRVEVDAASGTLTLTDLASGVVYPHLHSFDDGGDAGDTYNFSPPLGDQIVRSIDGARVHVGLEEIGPARATLRVDLDWRLPASLTADRTSRSSRRVATRITSLITLCSGARHLEVRTEWENRSTDHRLRALFPLGSPAEFSEAQGQFTVTRRPVVVEDLGSGWPETYAPTLPQQGWVSVHAGDRGLMIGNRGLPEFEVLDDGQGTIALTLLRSVGWLSRDDLLTRVGGAGPTTPTPDAQLLGPNRASYAIIPHTGDWLASGAYRVAEEYVVPVHGSWVRGTHGSEPGTGGLLELVGDHTLLLSAVKKCERDELLVLRFWNVASEPTETQVRLLRPLSEALLLDLKEDPVDGGTLNVDQDSFSLRAGPAQIVTVGLRLGPKDARK